MVGRGSESDPCIETFLRNLVTRVVASVICSPLHRPATSLPFVLRKKHTALWRSGSRHRCSAKYVHVRCNSDNFDGEASSLVEKIELRPAIFTMPAGSATAYKFSTILPFRLTLAVFSKTKPRMSAEIWFSSSTKIIRGPYNT